jgi:hypothetical protein
MGRRVRPCTVRGPLAPWAAGFEGWLVARGYSPWTVRYRGAGGVSGRGTWRARIRSMEAARLENNQA